MNNVAVRHSTTNQVPTPKVSVLLKYFTDSQNHNEILLLST